MTVWHDLSDDELRARLVQRGVTPSRADRLVRQREHPETARVITVYLSRGRERAAR